MLKYFIRILFLLEPESAHHIGLKFLKIGLHTPLLKRLFRLSVHAPDQAVELMGLKFRNRLGLAAGFDKNAEHIDALAELGFGFVEVGTVTPIAQVGNPKPRLFRLPKDQAIINRMGFNNDGLDAIAERLKHRKSDIIVGGNIGKNKVTSLENAADDYLKCFVRLHDLVDYFTVNVSSPNTPGLRKLQDVDELSKILNLLCDENQRRDKPKPILLKIAPDLSNEAIIEIAELINSTEVNGIIATNTTISREKLSSPKQRIDEIGAGGLSGLPLTLRAEEVCILLKQQLKPEKVLVGVGGIMLAEHARKRLNSGADLVQIYSGFIYGGPDLVHQIASAKI